MNTLKNNLSPLKINFNFSKILVCWMLNQKIARNAMFMNVQIVCKTPWTFRPPNYKLPIQAYNQTMYVGNMKKAKTELIKQSKSNKITTTAEIKWQRLREERCKCKDNTAMCYRKGNQSLRCKTSPPPSKRSIIH